MILIKTFLIISVNYILWLIWKIDKEIKINNFTRLLYWLNKLMKILYYHHKFLILSMLYFLGFHIWVTIFSTFWYVQYGLKSTEKLRDYLFFFLLLRYSSSKFYPFRYFLKARLINFLIYYDIYIILSLIQKKKLLYEIDQPLKSVQTSSTAPNWRSDRQKYKN